jgi:hypothetical protein
MSDSETPPGPRGRLGAAPDTAAQRHSWRTGWNAGLLRAFWAHRPGSHPGRAGSSVRVSPRPAGGWVWILIMSGILVCLPVVGMVLGYLTRPPAGTASITPGGAYSEASQASAANIPKPAPGKPWLSASQAPPPTITSPTPAPIAPVTPPEIAAPAKPLAPMTTPAPQPPPVVPPLSVPAAAKAPFQAVTYPARHDKHFGGECEGQLTLNSTGLAFTCPGRPDSGLQVAINQIASADDNGVRLTSGKKYHFTIVGMNKGAERALFADWLSRLR